MKSKKSTALPVVAGAEIQRSLPKTEAILLRLSVADKAAITATAMTLHLTATEYLVNAISWCPPRFARAVESVGQSWETPVSSD